MSTRLFDEKYGWIALAVLNLLMVGATTGLAAAILVDFIDPFVPIILAHWRTVSAENNLAQAWGFPYRDFAAMTYAIVTLLFFASLCNLVLGILGFIVARWNQNNRSGKLLASRLGLKVYIVAWAMVVLGCATSAVLSWAMTRAIGDEDDGALKGEVARKRLRIFTAVFSLSIADMTVLMIAGVLVKRAFLPYAQA